MTGLKVVGLGGSLKQASRSRAALVVALEGATVAGASVELLDQLVLDRAGVREDPCRLGDRDHVGHGPAS